MSSSPDADKLSKTIIAIVAERKPQSVRQVVALVKEQLPVSEEKILAAILDLRSEGRLDLDEPAVPPMKVSSYLMTGHALWYRLTIAFTVMTGIAVFAIPVDVYPWSIIRNVFGLLLVYLLPGYAFVKAVFPFRAPIRVSDETLEAIERLALSFGVSLALTPTLSLIFYYTPIGLNITLITFSLLALTVILATVALLRELRTKVAPVKPVLVSPS